MTMNIEVNQLTNEVLALKEEIVGLKAVIRDLNSKADTATELLCPSCKKEHMISLPSMNLKLCGCTYSEPWVLKPKQKSILIKNLVGE